MIQYHASSENFETKEGRKKDISESTKKGIQRGNDGLLKISIQLVIKRIYDDRCHYN